jgi:hypothetical protein
MSDIRTPTNCPAATVSAAAAWIGTMRVASTVRVERLRPVANCKEAGSRLDA